MMRLSLSATASLPLSQSRTNNVPVSVLIKPANNVPGSFEYQTDSKSLFRLLRHKTDLGAYRLEQFRSDLEYSRRSRLPVVNFREQVLEELGYFVE